MKNAGCQEELCSVIQGNRICVGSRVVGILKENNRIIFGYVTRETLIVGRFIKVELLIKNAGYIGDWIHDRVENDSHENGNSYDFSIKKVPYLHLEKFPGLSILI